MKSCRLEQKKNYLLNKAFCSGFFFSIDESDEEKKFILKGQEQSILLYIRISCIPSA